jgi:hypothetical protein
MDRHLPYAEERPAVTGNPDGSPFDSRGGAENAEEINRLLFLECVFKLCFILSF